MARIIAARGRRQEPPRRIRLRYGKPAPCPAASGPAGAGVAGAEAPGAGVAGAGLSAGAALPPLDR
ncbi:hypothetical protein, partial [Achromobacter veterisilvae]|uniref:hypothetical protein n=1 Tax=Achromobacter veterisilvae TaxID=2069367 RepID=UPI001ABF1247